MRHRYASALIFLALLFGVGTAKCDDTTYPLIVSVRATPAVVAEGTSTPVTLRAVYGLLPSKWSWQQVGGPKATIVSSSRDEALIDVSGISVAGDAQLVFALVAESGALAGIVEVGVVVTPEALEPVLGENVHIGGATSSVALFDYMSDTWTAFNVGNRLTLTEVGTAASDKYVLYVPGYIEDIEIVEYMGGDYALLAMGSKGLAVVDIEDPTDPQLVTIVHVNYYQDGIIFAEGGGDIIVDNVIESVTAPITELVSDGTDLWLGDAGFGIHRTALSNLLGVGGPVLEGDGTLQIDAEVYTLQYAGEIAWGVPTDLKLIGGKLFATLDFLGLVIFDPASFERVGYYNLYTDASVAEDWFIDMNVADEVQPGFLDPVTGMPDYQQVNFEIQQVWKGEVEAPTPWADFDRYGKYYYLARAVDVATYEEGQPGEKSIAYIAYGLAGLVAVDVTGFGAATGASPISPAYLGYVPGVPAHGPDDETRGEAHSSSLFPHHGAGMLKEAGAVDVAVRDGLVYYTDHFAGLVVLEGSDDPGMRWHGASAPYDNDDPGLGDGVLGDHWPDYEWVTSFDMSPFDPEDHESLPTWMYEDPARLTTGEVAGHGNSFVLLSSLDIANGGNVDLVLAAAAGGLNFVDIVDLDAPMVADRFAVPVYWPTTDEIGAAADGTPTQPIAIGHAQAISASDNYLYIGDGPHGLSVWRIADELGRPIDDIHLVANTLQDEYQTTVGEETIYPTPHAHCVVYDPDLYTTFVLARSVGLRRVDVLDVEAGLGAVGSPLLLTPQPSDFFEHNGEAGTVGDINGQDHASDMARDGNLAFVADGPNGLTIYDLSKDPTDTGSGFFVSNLGNTTGKPKLGRATGVALWHQPITGKRYAFVAAGPRGVGVVDATDATDPQLIKVFEPIKIEDDKVGKADGRAVDVRVVGNERAVFSYDSFGIVSYKISDLIKPLPVGVDPTEIWRAGSDGTVEFDYRPVATAKFKLQEQPGYETLDGGALYMEHTEYVGRVIFYAAYGTAGLAVIDWSDAAAPQLLLHTPTVGEASSVALSGGRIYVADDKGGFVAFK